MRKVLAILLALMVLLSLTACGGGEVSSDPVDSTVSTGEADDSDTTTTTTEQGATNDESTTGTGTESGAPTNGTTNKNTASTNKPSASGDKPTTTTNTTKSKTTTGTQATDADVTGDYVTVNGSSKNLKTWVYQMADTGIYVREARFDSGKGGDPATIVAATDIHFTGINDKDRQENNAALMWTYEKRKGNFQYSTGNIGRIMTYAADYDQTVLMGDIMDYLSWGNIDQINKHIWSKDPKTLIALGNHDSTRTMSFSGQIEDTSTLASRYEILKGVWKHDIYYTSKVIKNKAMVIVLDNSQNKFWAEQLPKLKADLDTARKNGYVVLLFYHIALRTNNKDYRVLKSFYPNSYSTNFYNAGVYNADDATKQVYDLITNSADVIKGAFCGHEHFNFYMEINAKTPDGKAATIPQYVLTSGGEGTMGAAMKITVK